MALGQVVMYGMSDEVGLTHCARRQGVFLPGQNGGLHTDCSPHTVELIDQQVKQLLDSAYGDALL